MKTLFAVMVSVAQVVSAAGALPLDLSADDARAVDKAVAVARRERPQAFAAVQALRAKVLSLDAKKRGPFAAVTPQLKAIPSVTWALVDALRTNGALEVGAPVTARIAWQTGLLEALGAQYDRATEPVLIAALNSASNPETIRSAAEGLGRLGSDRAAAALVQAATTRTGTERLAVLKGMGACRRVVVAEFLARQASLSTDEQELRALVKGLSTVGNAWALETPNGAFVRAEIPALRSVTAGALVRLYTTTSGHVRQLAADAVLVVNAPETKLLLAQERAKDPTAVDALLNQLR